MRRGLGKKFGSNSFRSVKLRTPRNEEHQAETAKYGSALPYSAAKRRIFLILPRDAQRSATFFELLLFRIIQLWSQWILKRHVANDRKRCIVLEDLLSLPLIQFSDITAICMRKNDACCNHKNWTEMFWSFRNYWRTWIEWMTLSQIVSIRIVLMKMEFERK